MDGIDGKVAVVTGAGQGIGRAVATALAELGAGVAALDIDGDGVDDLAARLIADGRSAGAHTVDVTDDAAVTEAVDRIERERGPIDILVNVAGVLVPGPVDGFTDDDWHRTFAVNTTGVFHLCRAVSRRMVPRRRGAIVTVGSNAAGVPRQGMAAYGASKAAATLFTKSLGLELAEYGIRCNVVSPGSTDTGMLRGFLPGDGSVEQVVDGAPEQYKVGIPLRKVATPADIADGVVFLVSDRAGHVTMHDLYVDGGATLRA